MAKKITKGTKGKGSKEDLQIKQQHKGGLMGFIKPSVSSKDIVVFTRQFSTMINAGLPLVQCLDILSNQSDNKFFAQSIGQVKTSVESGDTFADALRKHPRVFTSLYTNMVEAGEISGMLDTILNRLAVYIEKSMALKKKIQSAMVYPSAIVTVAFGVVAFLLVFVIPTFATIFGEAGSALPTPTMIVLKASEIFKKNFLFVFAGIGAMVFLLNRYYKTSNGRKMIDSIVLKMPVVGLLVQKISVAKFTRTLGTLMVSGIPIIEGLEITAKTAGNRVVEDAIMSTINGIKEGQGIAVPLSQHKVFPPMVIQMIGVGETTGALDTMLTKIADFYDEEVDTAVANLTSMLEPMLMVFLGLVIGFVVIAMYLPIFKMASVAG